MLLKFAPVSTTVAKTAQIHLLIQTLSQISMYIWRKYNTPVYFWRAYAPVFLGSLRRETGRCPPHRSFADPSNEINDTQRKPRENPSSELFIVFRDQRIHIYVRENGDFQERGKGGERKFPTPTLLPHPPTPVLTLHSPHSWAAAKLTVPSASNMPAHRARQVFTLFIK